MDRLIRFGRSSHEAAPSSGTDESRPQHDGRSSDARKVAPKPEGSTSTVALPDVRPSNGDPLADDLIRRVVVAIDAWARDNDLDSLPREIVVEQALGILSAFKHLYKDRSESTVGDLVVVNVEPH